MINSAIVTRLRAVSGVTDIVAQRIYIGEATQGDQLPYVIVSTAAEATPLAHDGPIGISDTILTISCIATSIAARETLTAAVKAALHDFRGSVGGHSLFYCSVENVIDLPPLPDYGYQTAIDLRVIFS